jgi:hypothetical protein
MPPPAQQRRRLRRTQTSRPDTKQTGDRREQNREAYYIQQLIDFKGTEREPEVFWDGDIGRCGGFEEDSLCRFRLEV